MKRIFLLLAFFSLILNAGAQKAEPVYSFARIQHPTPWYKQQVIAWKKVLDTNPKDALGWYYYYYAHRDLMRVDTADKRSWNEKQAEINKIVEAMAKEVPNSFEYNLVKWQAGGFDLSLMPYLRKAEELGEGRREHLDFMINQGEIERDMVRRDKYCLKKYEFNDVSTGVIYYNYNVMAGLAPNTILISAGDNDTYPVWILQAKGIRKDITVLNLSLLHLDEYRARIFKELGIEKWDMNYGSTPDSVKAAEKRFKQEIIRHIAANKKKYPVSIALTAGWDCEDYTDPIAGMMYLTGLAYNYSKEPIDNMALLKRNFEQLYALDYIDKSFYIDISAERAGHINTNYIVPMLKLYDHYKVSGDLQRAEWIKSKVLYIVMGRAEEQEVKNHLAQK